MTTLKTWAFAAIMAATAVACGGDPGTSGGNTPDPTGGTGGGVSHTPKIVTFDVTVTPADLASVSAAEVLAAKNDEALAPWSTYAEYPAKPYKVDVADEGFSYASLDLNLPGYVDNGDVTFVSADLASMGDRAPAQFLVARDLTGSWKVTESTVSNGVASPRETGTYDLSAPGFNEAEGFAGYSLPLYNGDMHVFGDSIVGGTKAGTTGTIAPDGSTFTVEYTNSNLGLLRYEYVRQ